MKVEIFINGEKYLNHVNTLSKSFSNVITESIEYKENLELHQTKANEVATLIDICKKDNLVFMMDKHVTLDIDFANRLRLYDIIHCACLKPKTELGEVIRELMIDNYELVLIRRNWIETDYLSLDFEAMIYGESSYFLSDIIKGKI